MSAMKSHAEALAVVASKSVALMKSLTTSFSKRAISAALRPVRVILTTLGRKMYAGNAEPLLKQRFEQALVAGRTDL